MNVCRPVLSGTAWASFSLSASAITITEPSHFSADVLFATYSADLPANTKQRIDAPLRLGHRMTAACVVVVGHADALEAGLMDAQVLSLRRAQAVAAIFKADGYSTIYIESKGATRPVATPPSQQNARVEIDVYAC